MPGPQRLSQDGTGATLGDVASTASADHVRCPTNDPVAKNQLMGTDDSPSKGTRATALEFSTHFVTDTRRRREGTRKQLRGGNGSHGTFGGLTNLRGRGSERAAGCAATLQRYVKDTFGNEQHERGHADHPGTRGYEFPAMENEEVSEKDQSIAKRRSVCRALWSHVASCARFD